MDDVRQENPPVETPPVVPPTVPPQPSELDTLKAQMAEVTARIAEKDATIDRLTQLVSAPPAPVPPPAPLADPYGFGDDFAQRYSIPVEAARAIAEAATNKTKADLRAEYQRQRADEQAARDLHEKFYKDNPDLAAHKAVVAAMADEIQKSSPQMTIAVACTEAAKRSRAYIKSVQDAVRSGPEPLPILPGGGGGGGQQPPAPEGQLSPEAELQAELVERRNTKAKAIGQA